jgi:regulation of enolase protein 1 (concanavalin A-like superfamily)
MFAKCQVGLLTSLQIVNTVERGVPLSALNHRVWGNKDMLKLSDLQSVGQDYGRIEHEAESSTIFANAGTDAFSPPDGTPGKDCLIGLRLPVFGDRWAVSVCAAPVFAASFDAGAFMLRTAQASWAKLAYERAPDGRAMAVSVVTRGLSDDANGPVFSQSEIFLRACCTGKALAFHTSTDGRRWDLLRFFSLAERVTSVDLIAQSPVGAGCRVVFSDLQVSETVPVDLRDGS